jgi:predicted nucleotidyltransferase
MVTRREITELCDRIARKFKPERIILFGSYAYGVPNEDSDVDLLVVLPLTDSRTAKAIEIRNAIPVDFPLDLLACSPDYLKQRVSQEDFFLREIVEKGQILYEAAHAGVG